jgi:tellurite resistance protein TerC
VPVIFAVTGEPFLVFTSNVFAILGMRVLYSLLVSVVSKFSLLKYALGSILVFVGLEMAWLAEALGGAFPISWLLAIIALIVASFLSLSVMLPGRKGSEVTLPRSVL